MKSTSIFSAILFFGMSTFAHANIVVNGGFEDPSPDGWNYSSDYGFGDYSYFSDSNYPHSGVSGQLFDGNLGGPNISLSQILPTTVGQQYLVAFYLAAWSCPPNASSCGGNVGSVHTDGLSDVVRPEGNLFGLDINDLSVSFGDSVPGGFISNLSETGYRLYEFTATASSSSSLLNFVFDQYGSNQFGTISYEPLYLDDVSVTAYDGTGIGLNDAFNNPCQVDGSGNLVTLCTSTVFTPEPVTLSIFGAGLVGAAIMRRRKKAA